MFYAIMELRGQRVASFMTFDTEDEARAHCDKYDGVMVFESDCHVGDIKVVDGVASVEKRPVPASRLKGKAMSAVLNKLLKDEMAKPDPIPEVKAYKDSAV